MAESEGASSNRNIPKLDDKNFAHWSMRIKAHLRHKGLLKHVTQPAAPLAGAVAETAAKKQAEAVDILMNYMSDTAFEAVVTPDNEEDPHAIWLKIISRYASSSVNNKGRVWLKFMRYEYSGNLKTFITDINKMMNEIAIVNLGVPDDILSFSILAKLSEDLHNVVDNIIMNEIIVASPDATLTKLQEIVHLEESRKTKLLPTLTNKGNDDQTDSAAALMHESKDKKKKVYRRNTNYCTAGKHNPDSAHNADNCWQLHPELRPSSHAKPSIQLAEVSDGHESEVSLLLTTTVRPTVLDSGATHHMVNDATVFNATAKSNIKISTGGHNNFLNAEASGTITLVNHEGQHLVLDNALLVPTLNRSLISLPRLFNSTLSIKKDADAGVDIEVDNKFHLRGSLKNNLLELCNSSFAAMNTVPHCYSSESNQIDWHSRLGHPNAVYLSKLIPNTSTPECSICKICKLKALAFKSHFKSVSNLLEAVHLDLVGPFSVQSNTGHQYFMSITDQFSGFRAVKFLKTKSEAFIKFCEFKAWAEKQTGRGLRTIVSDGGGEFVNQFFKDLCAKDGIIHNISPAYTPQNNGMAERSNQAILVKAKCLLLQSRLPKSFWAEAINTATELLNVTPSKPRQMTIPYETWTGRSVNLAALRPFGCLTYSLIPQGQRQFKIMPPAEKGILLGYENDFSTYRIYKISERRAVRARDIQFDEKTFPGLKSTPEDEALDIFNLNSSNLNPIPESAAPEKPNETPTASTIDKVVSPNQSSPPKEINSNISTDNILSVDRRGNSIMVYLTEVNDKDEPATYLEAINSPSSSFWKKAIEKEIDNMESHDVWVVVRKAEGQKMINCTWVFKIKKDQLNIPIEYKARLCAKGFQQTKGVDFSETYAPTGKLVSLRMLIAYSLSNNLLFHQIDIKSAFLNAPLAEELYLNPPPGVQTPKNHVLKLNKAIYGLRQAPFSWHKTLSEWLFQIGFRRCDAEPCVFWRKGTFLYLHVDDLAIFSKDPEKFKEEVRTRFKIKDLGASNLLLGMNVTQKDGSITLSQRHYIDTQLTRFNCEHLYPASTPLKPNSTLVAASAEDHKAYLDSGYQYRSLVGALNYISMTTRPDITFAVSSLSQFLNKPGLLHWDAGIQVLRYLKGTRDIGLRINKPLDPLQLEGYADADWASCPESRRSVSGNLVIWGGNIISWRSKKQPTLSLSSTEAEYKSLGDITKDIMWIKTLLKKILNLKIRNPTPIFEDNQGAIALANNESNHSNFKTKHMSLRHHFIRREIKIKSIELKFVPTRLMMADFLTKSVGKTSIKRALRSINISCSFPDRS